MHKVTGMKWGSIHKMSMRALGIIQAQSMLYRMFWKIFLRLSARFSGNITLFATNHQQKLTIRRYINCSNCSPILRGNKRPIRCNNWFFIAKLTVRSTCFGHHYAHHQELKSYKDGCCLW